MAAGCSLCFFQICLGLPELSFSLAQNKIVFAVVLEYKNEIQDLSFPKIKRWNMTKWKAYAIRKSELCRIKTDVCPAQSQALQYFADGKSKKACARFPSPKRSRSAPILRADLFLMQTLINPQIDSISLQYPGGHRREIKIISGFAGAVIALLVTQPEELLFRTAFGSPHRKPLCYYNMSGNHGKSNLNGQKTDIL